MTMPEPTSSRGAIGGHVGGDSTFHYAQLVLETLRDPDVYDGLEVRPIDVEVIPNFSGEPDRIQVWLIFESREARGRANESTEQISQQVTEALVKAGFPSDSTRTLTVRLTSVPEIDDGGGRFAYFR